MRQIQLVCVCVLYIGRVKGVEQPHDLVWIQAVGDNGRDPVCVPNTITINNGYGREKGFILF